MMSNKAEKSSRVRLASLATTSKAAIVKSYFLLVEKLNFPHLLHPFYTIVTKISKRTPSKVGNISSKQRDAGCTWVRQSKLTRQAK